uniref:(northern house mosquito) hypothetical protein n=1 Tax=Culex pipiens TaxID=7175 RepID=A0A8D8P5U0_CULPI
MHTHTHTHSHKYACSTAAAAASSVSSVQHTYNTRTHTVCSCLVYWLNTSHLPLYEECVWNAHTTSNSAANPVAEALSDIAPPNSHALSHTGHSTERTDIFHAATD